MRLFSKRKDEEHHRKRRELALKRLSTENAWDDAQGRAEEIALQQVAEHFRGHRADHPELVKEITIDKVNLTMDLRIHR